jgi:hypothetical protein
MMITLGVLFLIDHSGEATFRKTWPVLVIIYAVLKLMEALAGRQPAPVPPGMPPVGGAQ